MEAQIPEDREWLTYREAQVLSGFGRTHLWERVGDGSIVAAKRGRSVRINRESLRDYMWSCVPRSEDDNHAEVGPFAAGGAS